MLDAITNINSNRTLVKQKDNMKKLYTSNIPLC